MSVTIKHPVRKMTYKNMTYFGEITVENEKRVPCGAGLYRLDNYSFVMCEKVYKDTLNGMTILARGNSGKLTYYERGIAYGPCIEFNDEKDIVFSNTNEYGKQVKFKIILKKDGTYYISQYNDYGDFNHRVLSFKKGLFCLEYRNLEEKERTAVIEKKVGWNFKYPFVRMFLMPYEDKHKGVAPAKIIQVGNDYIYRGGAQSPTFITNSEVMNNTNYNYYDFVKAHDWKDYVEDRRGKLHNAFYECRLDGYAIDYIDDESLYFGEVDDDRLGGICCRKYKDYDYLGYAEHTAQTPDRTGMKVYKNGVIEFGSFVGEEDVRFEIYNDFLLIKSYDKKQMRGNYYKLYFNTFDLEEYSINDELLEKITYPEVSEDMKKDDNKKAVIKTELTGEDLLDNAAKSELSIYEYTSPTPNAIEIYGLKKAITVSDFYVFDVVTKIKTGTFSGDSGIKRLRLPRNLKTLEKGSLNGMKEMTSLKFHGNSQISEIPSDVCDCPKLKEIGFPRSVKRIASGAFSECKNLTYVSIYEGTEVESGAFPKKCGVHIIYEKSSNSIFNVNNKKEKEQKVKSGKIIKKEKPYKSKRHTSLGKKIMRSIARPFKLLVEFFEVIFSFLAKPFRALGKLSSSLGIETNIFSIISILVMTVTALMNVFKVNVAINEWATGNMDVITGLFGMHLVNLITTNMSQSVLLNIILAILILVAFALDLIINVLVLVLFLVYMILFFVIGFAYALAVPIGMLIFAIVGLTQKRSATNIIILLLDIGLIVLFYVGISL